MYMADSNDKVWQHVLPQCAISGTQCGTILCYIVLVTLNVLMITGTIISEFSE